MDTGALRTITLPSSYVRGLVWFDDTRLILNAALPGSPLQLHQLSYPDGKLSPLTRDVNDYDGISVAADGVRWSAHGVNGERIWRSSIPRAVW